MILLLSSNNDIPVNKYKLTKVKKVLKVYVDIMSEILIITQLFINDYND